MQDSQLVRHYVVAVDPQISVTEASRKMCRHGVGSLPVVDSLGRVEGILTESDIVRAVSDGRDLELTTVGSVMTRNPVTVEEDVTARQAASAMCMAHARHLPVTRGARLVGMVSAGDLVRQIRKDVSVDRSAETA